MKKIIFIILLTVANIYSQNLKLVIDLEKYTYMSGEPVILKHTFINPSNTPTAYTPFFNYTQIQIFNEAGNPINKIEKEKQHFFAEEPLVSLILNPKEQIIEFMNLNFYSTEKYDLNWTTFLKPGKYKVSVIFQDYLVIEKDTLRYNKSTSNELNFEIIPMASEGKELFQKFIMLNKQRNNQDININEFNKRALNLYFDNESNPLSSLIGYYFILFNPDPSIIKILILKPNEYWVTDAFSSCTLDRKLLELYQEKIANTTLEAYIKMASDLNKKRTEAIEKERGKK